MEEERLMVLQMLSEQKITPQEAIELLRALESTAAPLPPASEPAPVPGGTSPADAAPTGEAAGAAEAAPTAEAAAEAAPAAPAAGLPPAAAAPPVPPPPPPPPPPPAAPARPAGLSALGELIEGIVSRLGSGLAPGIEYTETREGELPGSGPVALEVSTPNGRVTLCGWDQPRYRAVVTRRVRASGEDEARRRGEELAPLVVSPNQVSLRAQTNLWDITAATVEVWLPRARQYALNAKTGNGRIEVRDLPGLDARLSAGNGRIQIDGGSWGHLDAHSGNGSLRLNTSAARIDATTGNGSAEVILQENRSAEISLTTGNGSITLDTRAAAGAGFQVDGHTGVGEIRCHLADLEIQQSRQEITSRRLYARTCGYAERPVQIHVRARTGVGSITIE